MKKFLSLALSVLMLLSLLAGCGGGSSTDDGAQQDGGSETAESGGKLVVYSALNEDNTIAMAEQFEKDTGIEVEYISLGGGDAVARVQAEMSNPQADFLVGGSVDLYGSLAEAGALLEYDSPNNDDLDARFNDPNHLWQGWYMGVLSIIINEERFQEELASQGLAEPATWDDLLDPAYDDVFVWANPTTAGGAYIATAAISAAEQAADEADPDGTGENEQDDPERAVGGGASAVFAVRAVLEIAVCIGRAVLRAVRRLRIRKTVRSFLVRALAFGPRAFCFLRRGLGRLPVRAVQCKLRNGRLFRLFRSGAFFRCITHGGYAEAAVCANDAGHLLGAA